MHVPLLMAKLQMAFLGLIATPLIKRNAKIIDTSYSKQEHTNLLIYPTRTKNLPFLLLPAPIPACFAGPPQFATQSSKDAKLLLLPPQPP